MLFDLPLELLPMRCEVLGESGAHMGLFSRVFGNMVLSSLNSGPLLSFSTPRRDQRWCDTATSVQVSQSHRPPVKCVLQGLSANFVLHRFINGVKGEQSWRRSSPVALHNCILPSKRMLLEKRWQGAAAGEEFHAWLHGSINGTLPSKESINPSMTCHAQIHPEPWHMDDESLPSLELPSLLQTDRGRSDRLASAVGLIMGTAVGPGILGLPVATLHAGLIPSSVTIVAVWAYVMASILLVAELSYAVMAEQGGAEVSFTGLAVRTLGPSAGRFVALVYALLNYALLVACVAGLHSLLTHWLPFPPALVCLLSPGVVVSMMAFTSFQAVDALNRALCGLMLASITALVGIGISIGGSLWPGSIHFGTCSLNALYPAIPVIVLTLGFHVITPVVCVVVGGKPQEARKAILLGGTVPLLMVLAWNAVIVGLAQAPAGAPMTSFDPIKLLLSLSSTAAPVVQAFAFAALGTTLIGYALSFPKQLVDAVSLYGSSPQAAGREMTQAPDRMTALVLAMAPPVAAAMASPTAFASALDFAGVYANCFLFGVLPPIMAWVYRYQQPQADQALHTKLVPGGRPLLVVLLLVALTLGLKPPNARI